MCNLPTLDSGSAPGKSGSRTWAPSPFHLADSLRDATTRKRLRRPWGLSRMRFPPTKFRRSAAAAAAVDRPGSHPGRREEAPRRRLHTQPGAPLPSPSCPRPPQLREPGEGEGRSRGGAAAAAAAPAAAGVGGEGAGRSTLALACPGPGAWGWGRIPPGSSRRLQPVHNLRRGGVRRLHVRLPEGKRRARPGRCDRADPIPEAAVGEQRELVGGKDAAAVWAPG